MSAPRPPLTVLAFESASCPPCRALAPVLEALAQRYAGRVAVEVVDSEEDHVTAQRFGVRAVPTLLAMADGAVVAQQTGYPGRARVEAWFADLCARHGSA